MMDETIAAIATPHGVGSIAIVRVSGPKALELSRHLTRRKSLRPRYAHLLSIYDSASVFIDKSIVIYFESPHSFTGEEIVEFQCHGGIVVAQMILDTLLHFGARLAQPGEFSKRAFLNGKIDLSEAEAIAKLIEAKSADAAKVLARQLQGDMKHFVESTRESLLRLMAYSEVTIDYAEEDLPEGLTDEMYRQLCTIEEQCRELVETSIRRKGVIEGVRVAIIGKPNVGKSSLLNAFLAYERAIVSDIAGTTRDTIEEQVQIGTHLIRLIDTAGIRQTNDTIERIGVQRSMSSVEDADIIIALFDASRPFDEEDEKICELLLRLEQEGKTIIAALNKIDLPRRFDVSKLATFDYIEVSVKKQFKQLRKKLEETLDRQLNGDELMLVSARQIEAVKRAAHEVHAAIQPLQEGMYEFFSYHLQEAIKSLSSISRPYENEEILDKMFGEFCLGK